MFQLVHGMHSFDQISELIVKLMADRFEDRIKLFIDLIPFGISGCQLRLRLVGLPRFVDVLEGILLIPVQADSDPGQDGRAKRCGLLHFRARRSAGR